MVQIKLCRQIVLLFKPLLGVLGQPDSPTKLVVLHAGLFYSSQEREQFPFPVQNINTQVSPLPGLERCMPLKKESIFRRGCFCDD